MASRPANTQSLYGTIVGTVTDKSGAAIPDAKIEATQTETNEKRTAATNESGFYALSTIPSGTYVVSISKSGFDAFEARDLNLTINTTVCVDATLTVSGQPVTINVTLIDRLDSNGFSLKLGSFGKFKIRHRPSIYRKIPFTGEMKVINPKRKVKFVALGTLRALEEIVEDEH